MSIDYERLASALLGYSRAIVQDLFPAGREKGKEYVIGSLEGEPGDSLSINMDTGIWKDFQTGEGGGNLITLYAKKRGMQNGQAARELADRFGLPLNVGSVLTAARGSLPVFAVPPVGATPPAERDGRWAYTDAQGNALFYIVRVNGDEGKKRFIQYTWNPETHKWQSKAWPSPRPLYNLHALASNAGKRVLLVEGEKCADAGAELLGDRCVVTTWPGGAQAVGHVDWSPLSGREVTIWPDADVSAVGQNAASRVARALTALGCKVTVIDVSNVRRDKWDIADAVADGWTVQQVADWARENSKTFTETAIAQRVESGTLCPALTHSPTWAKLSLIVDKNGIPVNNMTNVLYALTAMGEDAPNVWFDAFKQKYMIDDRWLQDSDVRKLGVLLQATVGMVNIGMPAVWDGVMVYADGRARNTAHEYITTQQWDGRERIATFFRDVCGAEDNTYTRAISRNWFVGIVARAYRPGCQVDDMVILEGRQGARKSSMLGALFGDFFGEISQKFFDPREFVMAMSGHMVVEMGELHAFKTADIEQLKSFISTREDVLREPYARAAKRIPRSGVFVGTTNQSKYLNDVTGNRRFRPIACGDNISVETAAELRFQYLAEAKHLLDSGTDWYRVPEDLAAEEAEERREQDAWEDVVRANRARMPNRFTHREALKILFDTEDARISRADTYRIGRVLKACGYRYAKNCMRDGVKSSFFEESFGLRGDVKADEF